MSSNISEMNIAVLKGGPGSEREVSLASAQGVTAALRELGAAVVEVDVRGREVELPPGVEMAFNVIHGTFGEDGDLQAELEKLGVPYTGEGVEGSRLAFDKIATKRKLLEHGVATPEFEVIASDAQPTMARPYVVKAPREGSSVGIYIIKEEAELAPALKDAQKFGAELLIEKFVPGRELTVGVLGEQALPIIEIRPKEGFYDFKNKYPFLNPKAAGADHLCPAPLEPEMTARIQALALAATKALGLAVYSRVDVLLSPEGEPVVLEINTIPGMTTASLLPEAAGAAGISYPALCAKMIELSLARRPRA